MKTPPPSYLYILPLLLLATAATVSAQVTGYACGPTSYSPNTTYRTTLQAALSSLSAASSSSKFSNATSSSVNAVYYCRYDLPLSTCRTCVANATSHILLFCPNQTESIIWYEPCTLHYAPRRLLGLLDLPLPYLAHWSRDTPFINVTGFNRTVETTLQRAMDDATSNVGGSSTSAMRYFATAEGVYSEYQEVRCLVQCSPDLSPGNCTVCLKEALNLTKTYCLGSLSGVVFMGHQCHMRFGVAPFYRLVGSAPAPSPSSEVSLTGSGGSSTPASNRADALRIAVCQYGYTILTLLLLCNLT